MARFRVIGADRETGEDVDFTIEAPDQASAERIAARRNVMVSGVYPAKEEPVAVPPTAAPQAISPTDRKQCGKCKEWVDKGATKCPHCQSPIVEPWQYLAAMIFLGVVGFSVYQCGGSLCCLNFESRPATYSSSAAPTSPRVNVGENGRLKDPGWLAVTREGNERLEQLIVAGDTVGIAKMVESFQVLLPGGGTKVLVIDRGVFDREVRVLEGPYAGRSGWINSERLNP